MNVDRRGLLDGRTLHAGCPVEAGDKFGMNVWLRQRPLTGDVHGSEPSQNQARPHKPVRAPPRQTHASPAAQLSTQKRERS